MEQGVEAGHRAYWGSQRARGAIRFLPLEICWGPGHLQKEALELFGAHLDSLRERAQAETLDMASAPCLATTMDYLVEAVRRAADSLPLAPTRSPIFSLAW